MRKLAEAALRAVAIVALALILWRWTHPATARAAAPEIVAARGDTLGTALRRWTTTPVGAGHVAFDGPPSGETRAWMRALGRAGMRVDWEQRAGVPLAMSADAVADPAGGVRVDVAAVGAGAGAAPVVVGDALAAADTARLQGRGATLTLPAAADTLVARSGTTAAHVGAPPAPRLGAVLVLGRAGWEAKFVAAALEERGWAVQVRLAVAPGLSVTEAGVAPNAALAPDTARIAAVVVLDSGAVDGAGGAALARYVRTGGGLVLVADAAGAPALRPLAAGGVGAPIPGVLGGVDGRTPRRGLALLPIDGARADAVVLERREGEVGPSAPVAVAARRIGAGRVAQVGYVDTWRWRMAASDDAPAAHRAWWARLVAAVAYAPTPTVAGGDPLGASPADPAPLAATIAVLGPPTAAPRDGRRGTPAGPWPSDGALATLAGAALLGEVASRRLRGAR